MRGKAIVYAPTKNADFGVWSAGAFANYILRGEENTKKSSIRRDSFYISQGFEAKSYHRTKGDVVRGWNYHDIRWLNSRESRGNKRKKTEKFGAVHHTATTKFHRGIMPLPNELEVWEAKILARRIAKLFPKDCPFLITLHFGKQYEEREADNLHFHYMFSDRHDFGIGKKVEKLFDSRFDKKTPKGRPAVQDMIEDVAREFYIERGFDVVETGTKESILGALERRIRKLEELEQSGRNDPLKRRKLNDEVKLYEEKYVAARVAEFDEHTFKFDFDKELALAKSVEPYRKENKKQVVDSIDVAEKTYYRADDRIVEVDDGRETRLKSKKDVILEESKNTQLKTKAEIEQTESTLFDAVDVDDAVYDFGTTVEDVLAPVKSRYSIAESIKISELQFEEEEQIRARNDEERMSSIEADRQRYEAERNDGVVASNTSMNRLAQGRSLRRRTTEPLAIRASAEQRRRMAESLKKFREKRGQAQNVVSGTDVLLTDLDKALNSQSATLKKNKTI